jgi:hypothetical protein
MAEECFNSESHPPHLVEAVRFAIDQDCDPRIRRVDSVEDYIDVVLKAGTQRRKAALRAVLGGTDWPYRIIPGEHEWTFAIRTALL